MNNNPKSNTRKYSTATYTPRSGRNRKHNQNKLIFFVLLAVLIIALIVAISFVVVDLIGSAEEETTPGATENNGTQAPGPGPDTDGHGMSKAIDGDKATYMLSLHNQSVGSFFSCNFKEATEVGQVDFASTDSEYYIRSAMIQLKVDDVWVTVGEVDSVCDKSYNISYTATAVRVLLTANADTFWAINELAVKDMNGNAVALLSPSAVDNSGDTVVPGTEPTTDPGGDITTAPIVTDPPSPETVMKEVNNSEIYTGSLILVNVQNAYRFPLSEASLLNLYDEYYANDYHCNYFEGSDIRLEATATRAIFSLLNAMYTETGINKIILGTGYRTYDQQQSLADRYPATAALPGHSEHHTGLGIDIQGWVDGHPYNLDDPNATVQKIYAWFNSNAYKYGYVRRFAPDKDIYTGITSDRWHYRYVDVPHAYYMTANNLCLEEYLSALENNCMYGTQHLLFDVDGKSYEVYFVPASSGDTTQIPVPANYPYTISGNNYSGFIVTITRG